MLQKIKEVIASPSGFFTSLREKEITPAFFFLLVISAFYSILQGVVGFFATALYARFLPQEILKLSPIFTSSWISLLMIPVAYIFFVIDSFIVVALMHLGLRIFKGQGTFTQTFQVFVYSFTPTFLFGWIPILGILASIWTFILEIVGFATVHKVSRWRAFFGMILIPAIIFILIFGAMLVLGVGIGLLAKFAAR